MTPEGLLSRLLPAALLCFAAAATPASAATLYVANDGADSPTCGPKGSACRTMTQTIDNAADGDTISVGSGVYGDINRNGVLGEAGEEPVRVCGSLGQCVLWIDKPVTIVSEAGAFSTLLEGGQGATAVVVLTASGATFGSKGKGFTLQNEVDFVGGIGVYIAPGAGSNVIAGNVFVSDSDGQSINASAGAGGGNQILDNLFPQKANNFAVLYIGDDAVFGGNTVSGAAVGFFVGFSARPQFTRNVIVGAQQGIYLQNVTDAVIAKNSIVGSARAVTALGGGPVTVNASNLFGGTYDNCAVETDGADVTATKSYWGDVAGPGPLPANEICTSGTAVSTPFATKAWKVKPKPLR